MKSVKLGLALVLALVSGCAGQSVETVQDKPHAPDKPPVAALTATTMTTTATSATPPPPATQGYLTVTCNPTCDSVVVGGRSLGPSPVVRAALDPGEHTVTLKRSGHQDKDITVDIKAGRESIRDHVLLKEPPAVQQEHSAPGQIDKSGFLTVDCDPGCDEVIVDGTRKLGPAPQANVPVSPGKHQITMKRKGAPDKTVDVVIVSAQTVSFRASMASDGIPQASPEQLAATRASLEPKVWADKATMEEMRLLKAICTQQADAACRDRAAGMIRARQLKEMKQPSK